MSLPNEKRVNSKYFPNGIRILGASKSEKIMESKTYKIYHKDSRWRVTFVAENGELLTRSFAYKRDTKELIQTLKDLGYRKTN